MARVLVADKLNERGVELMRRAGIDVHVQTGLAEDTLTQAVAGCDGLIVRSATTVSARIIEAADALKAIGRAGVGVDNIDVPAATRRGIVVMNTPLGNIESAAEHTLAMLLAAARNVAAAAASMKKGEWEKKLFTGVELAGKTIGIVGLGKVGQTVCRVARALDMQALACDPYLPPERAEAVGARLVSLEQLLREADFVTLHTPLTEATRSLINKQSLALMKPGAILVNCARGGVVDEAALYDALAAGRLKMAALDVFSREPLPPDAPLRSLPNALLTPHLGASTVEAQERVADDIARQFVEFFVHGRVVNAVNLAATLTGGRMERFAYAADIAGQMASQMSRGPVERVQVSVYGEIAANAREAEVLALYALRGVLSRQVDDAVNLVNVSLLAETRGIEYSVRTSRQARNFNSYLSLQVGWHGGQRTVAGTLFEDRMVRVCQVDGLDIELAPSRHMLAMFYEDRPGMVGRFGTILGESDVNIASMAVGRKEKRGRAAVVLSLDDAAPAEAVAAISQAVGTGEVYAIELSSPALAD